MRISLRKPQPGEPLTKDRAAKGRPRIGLRPTAGGALFLAVPVIILLIAINSGSNAAFALAFMICGVLAASAWQARAVLAGLQCEMRAEDAVFAGEDATCRVRLSPAAPVPVTIRIKDAAGLVQLGLVRAGEAEAVIARPASARGWLPQAPVWLTTAWPAGLMRARLPVGLAPPILVYPRPIPADLPTIPARDLSLRRGDPDTLAGLAVATDTDRRSHIAWKALARSDVLLVRRFESEAAEAIWLEWDQCEGDTETRLSRLAGLVLAASRHGVPFGLRLPGLSVPPGNGGAHRHRCLRGLALYGIDDGYVARERFA